LQSYRFFTTRQADGQASGILAVSDPASSGRQAILRNRPRRRTVEAISLIKEITSPACAQLVMTSGFVIAKLTSPICSGRLMVNKQRFLPLG